MPVSEASKDLRADYERLIQDRSEYLEWAQEAADVTLPTLRPKGDKTTKRPYTQLGAQAVRSLSATLLATMMPPNVKWLKLEMDPSLQEQLKAQMAADPEGPNLIKAVNRRLAVIEQYILITLAAWKTRSRLASTLRRMLVEGNVLVNVMKTGVRFFPLREFVSVRNDGEDSVVIAREEIVDDPVAEQTEALTDVASSNAADGGKTFLYTLIDYERGEVWQQEHDQQDSMQQVDDSPLSWFVSMGAIPDIDNYATSYVYDHVGLINEINHTSARLGEAAAAAAWNIPVIRPGAIITARQLAEHPSGRPLLEDPENLTWFTSGVKLADWAFVGQYRITLREELASIFAMGLKDRALGVNTATEVLQIATELDRQTQDLLAATEETYQYPLIQAIMHVRGYDQIQVPGIEKAVQVIITSGQSALAREQGFRRLIESAGIARDLDPSMVVDGVKLMEEAGAVQAFETGGIFSRALPAAPEGGSTALAVSNGTPNGEVVQTRGGPQRVGGAPQPG